MTEILDSPARPAGARPDGRNVKRWLIAYVSYLLVLAAWAAILLRRMGVSWEALLNDPRGVTEAADPVLKLLVFAIYVSLACTFFPLPTGWVVAAVATRHLALSDSVIVTTLVVATVGALASVVANLHDYHLFTLILRHRFISRIRDTKLYAGAVRWFARRPFGLLVIFSVLPIPIDVVRMLAATRQYPLRPFAAANFIGRWVRYATIAAVTFEMGDSGWILSAALLAMAAILAVGKVVMSLLNRRGRNAKRRLPGLVTAQSNEDGKV